MQDYLAQIRINMQASLQIRSHEQGSFQVRSAQIHAEVNGAVSIEGLSPEKCRNSF